MLRASRHVPCAETATSGRTAAPDCRSARPPAVTLLSFGRAVLDGLKALRAYDDARSRGMPHDPAVRHAFGMPQARGDRVAQGCCRTRGWPWAIDG